MRCLFATAAGAYPRLCRLPPPSLSFAASSSSWMGSTPPLRRFGRALAPTIVVLPARRFAFTAATPAAAFTRARFTSGVRAPSSVRAAFSFALSPLLCTPVRAFHSGAIGAPTRRWDAPAPNPDALQRVSSLERGSGEKQDDEGGRKDDAGEEDPFARNSGPGYLPFPAPFHTINIIMLLFIANVVCYFAMMLGNEDVRDFLVEHLTLSHENFNRIYPIFTNVFYQENLLQLLIDCWLLWQFGDTMLGFLGNTRMTFFALLCTLGGSVLHVARQKFELRYGMDELEVRGRCYGPNTTIMGLVAMEGLIFRHLNFIQQPPVPFLVLTAFVMVIDVWRIFTTRPEEHGASTGGALMAYLFWALPTRLLGLDKLTATF